MSDSRTKPFVSQNCTVALVSQERDEEFEYTSLLFAVKTGKYWYCSYALIDRPGYDPLSVERG